MKQLTAICLLLAATSVGAQWSGPYGAPGFPRGGYPGAGFPGAAPLTVQTSQSEDGYYLTVAAADGNPSAVEVSITGNMVSIRRVGGAGQPVTHSDSYSGPNQYGYSYSYSSGGSQASRRMSLPPDADGAAAVREDRDSEVVVFIPRRKQ